MDDPTPNDRVPLDRPPVPRFSPLPDLPDLPEFPRGSTMVPTPSIPIPAPPLPNLPPPRVTVDLPRPSPSVSIDPPKPRPAPPTLSKPPVTPPVPVPTPVVASTPAPKGRWVGEALASLVTPTKSKATVLAAAGSLVAGAFVLQLLVGSGGDTAPSTPSKTPEVVATKKPAEDGTPRQQEPNKPEETTEPRMPLIPEPGKPSTVGTAPVEPLPVLGATDRPTGLTWPDTATTSGTRRIEPATPITAPAMGAPRLPTLPNQEIVPAALQVPAPELPPLPAPGGAPPILVPTPAPAPVPPIPVPTPAPTSAPATIPTPTPTLPAAEVGKVPVVTAPTEAAKPVTLPTTPVTAIGLPKPPETPAIKPIAAEPLKPTLPDGLGFKFDPEPKTATIAPPVSPLPVAPAPVAVAPIAVTPFGGTDPAPQPKPVAPTPVPSSDVRTSFDVDLHPAKAGQTYEAVSLQHYSDAKYADALRRFNKDRDPTRDEVQIPPTHVLRKLAAGGRATTAPATASPVTPAAGETWAPPATLGGVKPVAAGRSYTVPQDGTTFRDIAGTLLNDRKLYQRISDLNPTIDSNAQLRKGETIRVP